MNDSKNLNIDNFNEQWEKISNEIITLGQQYEGDIEALLSLLRVLENLHKEIREGLFQDCLPDNRQALYALLKDIENTGGWPYIYRGRLKELMAKLSPEDVRDLISNK